MVRWAFRGIPLVTPLLIKCARSCSFVNKTKVGNEMGGIWFVLVLLGVASICTPNFTGTKSFSIMGVGGSLYICTPNFTGIKEEACNLRGKQLNPPKERQKVGPYKK